MKSFIFYRPLCYFLLFIVILLGLQFMTYHTVLATQRVINNIDPYPTQPSQPTQSTLATQKTMPKDVVVLLVPGLSMDDLDILLTKIPSYLHQNMQLGGMTLRTASGMNSIHNVMVLTTGQQEKMVSDWNGYHVEERIDQELTAGELYMQRGGKQPTFPIIHPSIFKWQNTWREEKQGIPSPGWLGKTFRDHGIETLVLGNSDSQATKKRVASLFVMDPKGQAKGLISSKVLKNDPFFPTGAKTNWNIIEHSILEMWKVPSSTFSVIELGDLERIYSSKDSMEEKYFNKIYNSWFQELGLRFDALIQNHRNWQLDNKPHTQHITQFGQKELFIWVVSPWVSPEAQAQGRMLAPILTWNPEQDYGLLSSVTTKQSGIVTNLDFLPTLLNIYHIPKPPDMVGQMMKRDPQSNETLQLDQKGLQLTKWNSNLQYMFSIYDKRRFIITAYIISIMISLVSSTVYWWFYRHSHGAKVVQMIIGAILCSPLYFLWLTPMIQVVGELWWIVILFTTSLGTSMVLYSLSSTPLFLGMISIANAMALIWDMIQGSMWMKRSFLGYDAMIAARFYGIGNEYAGILLGASIIVVTSLYVWFKSKGYFEAEGANQQYGNKRQKAFFIASSVWYGLILFLVGAPQFGTNAGALLACLGTFPIAQVLLFQYKFQLKQVVAIGICLILGFLGFVLLHLQSEHTHISAVLALIKTGDWQPVLEIVARKWSMNMKLIRVSLWGKLFVISLIILLLFFFRARREKGPSLQRDPWFNGFRSIVLGAVLLLLVNDSGIVAAATAMIYVTFPFIYLRFDDQPKWSTTRKESA